MKVLHLLHVVCAQAFYRWAMREIPNTIGLSHPDVPRIILRQQQLRDKASRLWA